MIRAVLIFNTSGKSRLVKFFDDVVGITANRIMLLRTKKNSRTSYEKLIPCYAVDQMVLAIF